MVWSAAASLPVLESKNETCILVEAQNSVQSTSLSTEPRPGKMHPIPPAFMGSSTIVQKKKV
jgi:hypothetical protein